MSLLSFLGGLGGGGASAPTSITPPSAQPSGSGILSGLIQSHPAFASGLQTFGNRIQNPMFQMGLGLLNGGMGGQDWGSAMMGGLNNMQGVQQAQQRQQLLAMLRARMAGASGAQPSSNLSLPGVY